MRTTIIIILIVVLIGIGYEVFTINKENQRLKKEFNELSSQLEAVQKENEKLKSDLEYYSKPENLEKELRSKFNYKKEGEQTIIITP